MLDWEALARELGAIDGRGEGIGRDRAERALARIAGVDFALSAVEHYLAARPGAELARSVLAISRPPEAADYCLRVVRSDAPVERRRAAAELCRVLVSAKDAEAVASLMRDPDPQFRAWGVGALEMLVHGGEIPTSVALDRLSAVEGDSDPAVRRQAQLVREAVDHLRPD